MWKWLEFPYSPVSRDPLFWRCVYEFLVISRNAEIWVNNICGTNQGGFKVKKWFLLISGPNGYEVKKFWRKVWDSRLWVSSLWYHYFSANLGEKWSFKKCRFGNLNLWTHSYIHIWTYVQIWIYEHMNIWIYEYMNIWTYVHIWIYEHMNIWTHRNMNITISSIS